MLATMMRRVIVVTKKLVAMALATSALLGAYGRSFSLDLRVPRQSGSRANLMSATPAQDEGAIRSFDLDAGAADVGAVALGDDLTFTLFDDVVLTLTLKEKMPSPLGGDVFLAEVAGYEGIKTAVVLCTADGLTIDVQDFRNRKYYKVLSTPDGVKVQEVEAKATACGCDALTSHGMPKTSSAIKSPVDASSVSAAKALQVVSEKGAGESFVDILIAFDGNAISWAKSNGGGLTNFAETAVQKMNMALANTGLDASFRFRLVGVVGVVASSSKLDYALDAAWRGRSGWESIGEKREKVGADIVTILIDTGSAYGTTGLGFSLGRTDDIAVFSGYAYNACSIRSVAQSHTMTHEVGHNMGCGHSDVQYSEPGPQLYEYSAGYYFSIGGEGFHTIMAYDGEGPKGNEVEVPYFSSPKYKYRNVAVGDAAHDNTRTLSNTFSAVAKWRAATGADIDNGGMDVPLEWLTSRSAALARARAEGKDVFLISGRNTCSNTMATRDYSCEVPDVKRHLLKDYVCWYNVIDTKSAESQKYFSGHDVGSALPFIAVIDAEKDATLAAEGGYHEAADLLLLLGRAAKEVAITPDGGDFADSVQVTMTARSGGVIYYTLDGTMPDETSSRYDGPITLDVTATICAREFLDGEFGLPSSASFVRALTEEHGGYEWAVNVVNGGCVVKSVKPTPAGSVAIPANVMGFDVVGFDETVFQNNVNITSVAVPATVRYFDGWSFHGSRNLTAINVDEASESLLSEGGIVYDKSRTTLVCCPPGVTYLEIPGDISVIGEGACSGLWNVKEVFIPANVASIGFGAFAECKSLSTVVIAETVEEINYDAFSYCPKLSNAWLPRHLEYGYMEYYSFYKQTGRVSLHYYSGGVETFTVRFDPCDIELAEVRRTIPSIGGKVLMAVGTLPEAKRLNYAFLGWFTAPEGGTKVAATTKATDDVTYYAHWLAFAVNGETWATAETPMSTNVMCGVALRWPVAASALSGASVKVSGLPAGLKFTAKDILKKGSKTEVEIPANTIYGAPTAASKAGKPAGAGRQPYQVKSSVAYLLNLTVDPLPAWAVGNFEGFVGGLGIGEWGVATMSVTAAGKISGKVACGGTNWTFKADSFAAEEDGERFTLEATATAGKSSRNVALDVQACPTMYLPGSATARADGTFAGESATLFRLPWTDKNDAAAKAVLAEYAGAYSSSEILFGDGEDKCSVAFTLNEKGTAKGSIFMPDGTKTRKVAFSANVLTYPGSPYVAIYAPPDAKKGYPEVFALRQLESWAGPDEKDIIYRDPGVLVTTAPRNSGSAASGTVTMNPKYGQAAAGKDVTLTAKADKGSVFSCWLVSGADTTGLDLTSPTIKLKANGTDDISATAQFVTLAEDQGEIMLIVDDASLYGKVNDPGESNVVKRVPCGVAVNWAVRANAYSQTTIKAEKLPDGLKLVQDKATKAYSVAGVPTKAGTFPTKFTVTTAGKSKETVLLPIEVRAMPADIVGSYTGMVGGFEDPSDDETWRAFGTVTLSVAANGKLSAKATRPQGAVSFAANGWDSESNGFYRVEMSTKAGDRLFLKLDGNRDWKGARIEKPDSVLTTAKGAAYLAVAWRNEHGKTGKIATDKTASDFIARIVALKKLCFKVTGDAEEGFVAEAVPPTDKTANLTLAFDAKGNVKYSGKVGGKAISGTAVLNIASGDYCVIGDLAVPLGKTEALYLALGFDRGDGGAPEPGLQVFYVTE